MATRMFPIGCGATLRELEENPHLLLIQTVELWRIPNRFELLPDADQPKLAQQRPAVEVFLLGQGSGDTADVGAVFGSGSSGEVVFGDDIGDSDAPARSQDTEHLGEHGQFVDR
jgi:hypothetical protein